MVSKNISRNARQVSVRRAKIAEKSNPKPEEVDDERVYEWLKGKLRAREDKTLFSKALVNFADLVLDDVSRHGPSRMAYSVGAPSFLGHTLKITADVDEQEEYSVLAMEFAGYAWDLACLEEGSIPELCQELIHWLQLDRKTVEQDEGWRALGKLEREFVLDELDD